MAKLVRLLPGQKGHGMSVKHPVIDAAVEITGVDEFRLTLEDKFNNCKSASDKLVLHFLGYLGYLVGLYLKHWPITQRYLDDIVSEGLVAIVTAVEKYAPENLGEIELVTAVQNAAKYAIEKYLAENIGIVAAPFKTNRTREAEGKDAIIKTVESDLTGVEVEVENEDSIRMEVIEVVDKIKNDSRKKYMLLEPEYWGLTAREASDKSGIPLSTVYHYRKELRDEYNKKSGETDA